jgi:hypothetical protein
VMTSLTCHSCTAAVAGRQIGVPASSASAQLFDIDLNAVAKGGRKAGLRQQVVAPGNGPVEVSGWAQQLGALKRCDQALSSRPAARQRSLRPSSICAASASLAAAPLAGVERGSKPERRSRRKATAYLPPRSHAERGNELARKILNQLVDNF